MSSENSVQTSPAEAQAAVQRSGAWRKFVFPPVILLLVAIGFHLHLKWKTERYRKELRQQGVALTSLPPFVPYQAEGNAEDLVVDSIGSIPPLPQNFYPGSRLVAPALAQFARGRDYPGLKGEDLWILADSWARKEMRRFMALHSVLTNSHLTFSVQQQLGVLSPLTHLARFKGLAQLLAGHTYTCIRLGETNVAFSNLLAAAHLVRIYTNEPTASSQLVRIAIAGITWAATWEAVESGILNEAQLAALQQRWETINFLEPFRQAHRFEMSSIPESFQQMRESQQFFRNIIGAGNQTLLAELQQAGSQILENPMDAMTRIGEAVGLYPAWKFYSSYSEELAVLKEFVRANHVIERSLQTKHLPVEAAARAMSLGVVVGGLDFRHMHLRAAAMQVRAECLVAAVAAHRYKLRHGHFPASLEELVPEFASSLPHDWMSGKPLRYRLLENGRFLVYSVGEDRVDNGGNSPPENRKSLRNLPDIAWPIPATEAEVENFEKKQRPKSRSISRDEN